jgi:O-antigen/teichoic acid export membrane protein
VTPPAEETPKSVSATLLVDELEATELPDAELASGAAGPMLGSFAATGTIQLVQAVIGVMLARILGPSDRGELAAIILWPMLITTVGSLGIAQSSTYFASRAGRLGTVVGSTLAIVTADALVLMAVGWLILPLALSGHDEAIVQVGQRYLLIFVPLCLLTVSMISILNGAQRFLWYQSMRLLLIGVTVAGIVALAIGDEMTVTSASNAYLLAYAVTATASVALVLRASRGRIAVRRKKVRDLLGFGLKSQLSQSMWALNERADQLVISAFFSAATLGLYVVAVTLTSLTTLIGFSFGVVALPLVARLDDPEERRRVARLIVSATLFCATLVSVPIFIAEPALIRFLFGEDFVGAAGVGRVLLLAGIVFGLNRVLEALLQAADRPLESSLGEGVALAVTAAGLALLLPLMGIMGAGVTSLIAYSASSAFMVLRAARALDTPALTLLKPEREMIHNLRSLARQLPGFGGAGQRAARR